MSTSVASAPQVPRIDPSEYIIDHKCTAHGAFGVVHRARKRVSGRVSDAVSECVSECVSEGVVAMKFFGYTDNRPQMDAIAHEIECMAKLTGVQGVVQIHGVFDDTEEGMGE